MPFYRVILRGYNFPGSVIGEKGRYGLYTTRWVQALNPKRAERKAVAMVWRDPLLAPPAAKSDAERAYLRLEKVEAVRQLPRRRGGGATWFKEEDDVASSSSWWTELKPRFAWREWLVSRTHIAR
ncbi:hypothetical protein [Sphingobium xenophagum]|jgi:hypothetical protein